ncbi:TRAF3-interacting protein 1-like isoform X2 [Acanthaster planci]|uniref:TRAF3-interacting protein 1 n=1 Tax=Acanthaster planci TaxID=133434 RepID=A0A8B7XXV1_ACAPL|nr:TRAF3-interacting protein 1-like isoform X2 [Acanthaster planci]
MGDFVKETQDTLGKLIKKPPLTEKLLRKPPFRFLHDIVTEVIRTTGFMKGLYSATEMDSQNVKDKENKIAFLQKAIDVVALVHQKPLPVKPSKIVAGQEPERTNELLQQVASAILNKLDSSDAVAQVLGGSRNESESSKPPRPAKDDDKIRDSSADKKRRDKENKDKKSSSDNRDRSSSRDREKSRDKDQKKRDRSKERDHHRDRSKDKDRDGSKERDRTKDRDRKGRDKDKDSRDRDRDRKRDGERERDKDRGETDRSKGKESERDPDRDRERRERRKRKEEEDRARQQQQNGLQEDEEDARPEPSESEDGTSSNRIPRPTSAKGQRRRPMHGSDDSEGEEDTDGTAGQKVGQDDRNDMVNGNDMLPPQVHASRRMARPSSARPAPPRVKKQELAEDPAMRIGSGKQVTSVIVDNDQNSEDEDDTFVVEETHPVVHEEPQVLGSESLEDDGEHGGLVKKILETKKELEGTRAGDKKDEKPIVMDAARRKERERVQREVEKLTAAIQSLTRSANPLGKIMDYLQEDVDSMQKELEMWRKENQEHQLAIKREQGITDSELEPLKAQLTELDQGIQDQLDTIATIKSNLLRGDEKIAKMVSTVAIS